MSRTTVKPHLLEVELCDMIKNGERKENATLWSLKFREMLSKYLSQSRKK
jgi:hypothetical protein